MVIVQLPTEKTYLDCDRLHCIFGFFLGEVFKRIFAFDGKGLRGFSGMEMRDGALSIYG